jgi:Tol biopolymer transport system component
MIAFIGGRTGKGYGIYIMSDDGTGIRCLTDAFPPREAVFFNPIWSPDGKSLAFTFKENILSPYSQVCTINVGSKEVRYLTPRERYDFAWQWLSNGSIVYKEETLHPSESDSYLCIMRYDGSEPRRIFHYSSYRGVTFKPDSYHSVAMSPDGSRIAMISWRDEQLYIVREGSTPVLIENDRLKIKGVTWSSDSSKLTFDAVRSRARVYHDLYISSEDGTNKQRVGRVLAESGFAWSPNDEHIATVSVRKGVFTINIIDTQSFQAQTVAEVELDPESGDLPGCPDWSPDSRCILYTTFADPYEHVYRAEIATGRTDLVVGDEGAFRTVSSLSWR